jgi:hypothetical protein
VGVFFGVGLGGCGDAGAVLAVGFGAGLGLLPGVGFAVGLPVAVGDGFDDGVGLGRVPGATT